jgi:hypothetical protein
VESGGGTAKSPVSSPIPVFGPDCGKTHDIAQQQQTRDLSPAVGHDVKHLIQVSAAGAERLIQNIGHFNAGTHASCDGIARAAVQCPAGIDEGWFRAESGCALIAPF